MYFSCFAKKSTKRRRLKGTFRKGRTYGMIATGNHTYLDSLRGAPPLRNPCARIAIRHPKMFRFSGIYRVKTCKSLGGRCSKIGTFLDTDWRCGGGYQRGRIFVAPLWPLSLVTFLAAQESNITVHTIKYSFLYFVHKKPPELTDCLFRWFFAWI